MTLRAAVFALVAGYCLALYGLGALASWILPEAPPRAVWAVLAGLGVALPGGLGVVWQLGANDIRRILWYGWIRSAKEGRKHERYQREE